MEVVHREIITRETVFNSPIPVELSKLVMCLIILLLTLHYGLMQNKWLICPMKQREDIRGLEE